MTAPLLTGPHFTIHLNAQTASDYASADGTCQIAIQCEQVLGLGYTFSYYEQRNGDWFRGPITSAIPSISPDSQMLKDINSMGIVAWLQANMVVPINAMLKSFLKTRVAAPAAAPAVPPATTDTRTVTVDNFVSKMNDGLTMLALIDKDGDGIPELYAK